MSQFSHELAAMSIKLRAMEKSGGTLSETEVYNFLSTETEMFIIVN